MANQAIATIEGLTTRAFVGVSALLLVGPWLALPWLSPFLILAITILLALPIGWASYHRRQLANLPLVLAPLALRTQSADTNVYQFQTWLGRGRTMRRPQVQISFRPDGAEQISLDPIIPCDVFCGPWTILAPDTNKLCDRPGVFLVRVQVQERQQTWEVQGQWESQAIEEGQFKVGFKRGRRCLKWQYDAWGQSRPTNKT
ncbi:MAG: hypothetical protein HN348_00405 [Proteobacteria bacterium]|nr:hypothetical protein [Pseudomonadota bacterium]